MTLVAIWTRQYIRTRDLKDHRIYMTDERMTKLVNESYDAGHDAGHVDGELQGRVNLRRAIESGDVEEIKRIP